MMAAASHRQLQPSQQKLPPVHLYYLSWCFKFKMQYCVPPSPHWKTGRSHPFFIAREWHAIQRMRSPCVPGPVFHRPDLKEKLGPGNEARGSPTYVRACAAQPCVVHMDNFKMAKSKDEERFRFEDIFGYITKGVYPEGLDKPEKLSLRKRTKYFVVQAARCPAVL